MSRAVEETVTFRGAQAALPVEMVLGVLALLFTGAALGILTLLGGLVRNLPVVESGQRNSGGTKNLELG